MIIWKLEAVLFNFYDRDKLKDTEIVNIGVAVYKQSYFVNEC